MTFERVTTEFEKEFPDRGWLVRRVSYSGGQEDFFASSAPLQHIAHIPGANPLIAKGVGKTVVSALLAMREATRQIALGTRAKAG